MMSASTTTSPLAETRTAPAGRGRSRLAVHHRRAVLALLLLPFLIIAYKASGLAGSGWLASVLSFEGLPHDMRVRTHHLLFTPVGALVVVFVRLTLGIRVLGPFRSVLLAIAFQVTGAVVGLAFFVLVMAAVVVLRPWFKSMRLPYFGRSAVLLTAVATLIMAGMMVGMALGVREVERVAYFPVVVLTLSGDAFATTLRREGSRSAVWRAGATALVGLAITGIASVRWYQDVLVRYPELMLTVLGVTIVTADLLALRLLQGWNPPKKRKKKKKSRNPVAPVSAGAASGSPAPGPSVGV